MSAGRQGASLDLLPLPPGKGSDAGDAIATGERIEGAVA